MEESVQCSFKISTAHLHLPYLHANNSSQIDQMQMLCTNGQPPFQPQSAFSSKHEADQQWKQLQAAHPQNKQKFYGLSHYAPTPSITTLARYVGCRRVVFVAQTATFCVVSATCRDTSLVMSQTQENVVSARVSKRHDI